MFENINHWMHFCNAKEFSNKILPSDQLFISLTLHEAPSWWFMQGVMNYPTLLPVHNLRRKKNGNTWKMMQPSTMHSMPQYKNFTSICVAFVWLLYCLLAYLFKITISKVYIVHLMVYFDFAMAVYEAVIKWVVFPVLLKVI